MPSTSPMKYLTTPAALAALSTAGDAMLAALAMRRKPRTSAAVLRRSLVSAGLTQGASLAGLASVRQGLVQQTLVEPVDAYRGAVGDVPVLIGQDWKGSPSVTTVNGKLVMVAGPHYEKLARREQEAQYRSALREYLPASTAVAMGLGAAASRATLHRVMIGKRGAVSTKRAVALGLAMAGAEAAIQAATRQVTARRRTAQVAAQR